MSYINDALKKAQQEKDCRYNRYSGIISGLPGPRSYRRRKWIAAAVSIMLMLAALFVWLATTGHLELPVVARQQTPEKVVTAGRDQAPATVAPGGHVARATDADSSVAATRTETTAPAAPPGAVAPPPEVGTLYREALAAQRNKKTEVAERLYRRILTLDAQHVEAMNNLGVIYMAHGRQEQAVALFSKAIVRKKDYIDPYYNLACLYAQRKDLAKSIAYLKSAIAIDRAVIDWAKTDMDMKDIRDLEAFKNLMEKEVR